MDQRIATVDKTMEIMVHFSFNPKKRYGQNFLINSQVTSGIVNKCGITKDTVVIEIGPGIGALTQELAEKAYKVICFEIDDGIIIPLSYAMDDYHNVDIINKDFLKINLDEYIGDYLDREIIVVSNLPYYITSDILIALFPNKHISKVVAMMQKEEAHRILKSCGGKDENKLTIFAKYFTNFEALMEISKNDFFPKPNIDSTVMKFEFKHPKEIDPNKFGYVIDGLFLQRRKTILNNLSKVVGKDKATSILGEIHISQNARAEDLCVDQIVEIMKRI